MRAEVARKIQQLEQEIAELKRKAVSELLSTVIRLNGYDNWECTVCKATTVAHDARLIPHEDDCPLEKLGRL